MNKTYFWKYLSENKIEIPIIQRDYAQGRIGKEHLRRRFLASLKKALESQSKKELRLDFVYGSHENGKQQPLDGQQRLTTLWLLHFYISLKAGKLSEASSVLNHFTYETRLSSREFCENLCKAENFKNFSTDIVSFIERQTWFYSAWKQDPTIQAMLRMLGGKVVNAEDGNCTADDDLADGIEKEFKDDCDFNKYWERLISKDCPIVFYQLPLENYGLTDDLYIKMNARGKQLTPFENLKADLIGYIRKRCENEDAWKSLLDVRNGISIKLDTTWAAPFWVKRSRLNTIDEIYLTFINRFFWNQLFMSKFDDGSYVLQVGSRTFDGKTEYTIENNNSSYRYFNADDCHEYTGFEPYMFYTNGEGRRLTPIETFKDMQTVFDCYCKLNTIPDSTNILHNSWDDDHFCFIPEYDNMEVEKVEDLSVKKITQIHRITFFSVCKYLREGEPNLESLRRWMRVVWNIVSIQGEDGGLQIRDTSAMRTAMELIDSLNSYKIYEDLRLKSINPNSLIEEQLKEETIKARKILADDGSLRKYDGTCRRADGSKYDTWEEVIMDAENYSFFHGSIRFLYLDGNGNVDWSKFDEKWNNIRKFFKKTIGRGQSAMNADYDDALLLKSLLSKFTPEDVNVETIWYKHRTFNNKPATWLYYLLNDKIRSQVDELLTDSHPEVKDMEKPDESDETRNALYLLTQTGLLDYVIKKLPESWIRKYNNHIAIYPSSDGVFLNASRRNNFLLKTPDIDVDKNYKIDNTDLLFKWNINFRYKGKNFQWYYNDLIYRMEDSNPYSYSIKNANGQGDLEQYFCFDTKSMSDKDIVSWLDEQVESHL